MLALIDCNNFFVSCERLFRPDLYNKPVIVLSNNDGCVVSRSNEAKALGIAMGEPYFKIKSLCNQHHVYVFSSNYALYSDLSHRVRSMIIDAWPDVEIYSIDEAFLDLNHMPINMIDNFCHDLQKKILKATGIPTSIGVGSTKTLAKLANHVAKKIFHIPVVNLNEPSIWLSKIKIGDVWGIGRQWCKALSQQGIHTAADLANANLQQIKNRFNIVLMRTAMELRGIPCGKIEVIEQQKSIMSSRSFGSLQTDYQFLAQALSRHCTRVYEKLRQQKLLTQYISVFVKTNRFRENLPQYHNAIDIRLIYPTDDLRHITQMAKFCLKKIFKPGMHYQKVGVLITHLVDKNLRQMDLFHQPSKEQLLQTERIMRVFDDINQKFGSHTIQLAAEGVKTPWAMKQLKKSPSYTTQWGEIPKVIVESGTRPPFTTSSKNFRPAF